MSSDPNNSTPLPGGANVTPAGGGENGKEEVVSVHEVLSEVLKRDFPDDEAALQSVKDTFDYVGKAGKHLKAIEHVMKTRGVSEDQAIQTIMSEIIAQPAPAPASQATPATPVPPSPAPVPATPPVNQSGTLSRDEYEADKFYTKNPHLEPHRTVIEAVRKPGQDRNETIKDPALSTLLEGAVARDTEEKKKTVAKPSQGLGAAPDKLTKAGESLKAGKYNEAVDSAVDAVLDTYPGSQDKD